MMIWYFLADTSQVSENIKSVVDDGLRIINNFYSEYKSIIIQLCATLILFLIVRFFFWNKITAVIKAKEKNEKEAFEALDNDKKEKVEIEKQIQVDLENAKQESYLQIERAKQKAYLEAEEIVKKAKIDASMQLANAKEEIDKENVIIKEDIELQEPLIDVSTAIKDKYVKDDDLKIYIHKKINEIDSYDKIK